MDAEYYRSETIEQALARLEKHNTELKAEVEKYRNIERNRLCVVPPNQETSDWSVYAEFDGEFGYDNEIGTGATLIEALEIASAVISDTEDVR